MWGLQEPNNSQNKLNQTLQSFFYKNLRTKTATNKIKITNILHKRTLFIGILIHKTVPSKFLLKRTKFASPKILIYAPINLLINKLIKSGIGVITRNKKWKPWQVKHLTHITDHIIVHHFYNKWQLLWNFYKICDNAPHISKVIYLLKYSCAITLSLKHGKKLRSYKIVFLKYNKHLTNIKNNKLHKFNSQSYKKVHRIKHIKKLKIDPLTYLNITTASFTPILKHAHKYKYSSLRKT